MSSTAEAELYEATQSVERQARRLLDRLQQNAEREQMGEPGPTPIARRLEVAAYGASTSAYGPTETQRQSLKIAREEFADVYRSLQDLVNGQFNALQEALENAEVPWTPGRGLPLLD